MQLLNILSIKITSIQKTNQVLLLAIITAILTSCAAPRSITNSGKVTPHKQLRFGSNFCGNISSSTATSLFDGAISTAGDYINEDTVRMGESVATIEKVALSYSLDPIGAGYDFYVRYGLLKKVDVGYKYASGVHVFDGMYQFMGSTGTIDNPGKPGLSGSIGIQYSSQSYELPFGFSKIQNFLGFDFKRKDILIPLIFSAPFGEEEKYGAVSFGLAYNFSMIKYGFDPDNLYGIALNATNLVPVESISGKKNYSSLGMFVNLKAGYKYVYLVTSMAVYYQNYGNYNILNNNSIGFSGFTFIPTIGLQFNVFKIPFLNKKGKKSKASSN
jgi:hypothetical protein